MHKTFVGLHIPKCAGTSFLHMALENLPRHQIYQNTSIIMNWNNDRPEFLDIQNYKDLRLIWGHSVHEQMLHFLQNPILFTGMRDPIERLISEARYQVDLKQRQGIQFDMTSWLERQKNPMTWFIINRFPVLAERENNSLSPLDRAKNALTAFDCIYFTDTFSSSANAIFEKLGVMCRVKESNKNARPDIDVDIDLSKMEYDIALYEWAREKFADRQFSVSSEINPVIKKFLSKPAKINELEYFLFNSMAGEYRGWGVLEQALGNTLQKTTRLIKEAGVYHRKIQESK